MGRLIVSTNMTLDGVVQDPTGEEGLAGGGWFEEMSASDRAVWAKHETEEALAASALLFGAHSYEWFARRWAGRAGVWGERLQELPKYVVSHRRTTTDWGPVTVLGGVPAVDVHALKGIVDGEVLVYGSGRLLGTLFDHGLVDELRLFVFPTALGAGRRLFEDVGTQRLDLLTSEPLGDGVCRMVYRVRCGVGTSTESVNSS
ncbi:dihydrofolate reductase family protein [Nocardioides sp. CER19]|uniref:dihydrofolate reductase family protein n=1 Tax=Nocardioides sp. CER19 TaxID=3038538 RepID=UPI00244A00FC|nr:dihydrofolate reductase family protein [Nocardioides sp. CER19]MDH2415231.1 dihydrofolate reductase family protein [Nocardioides sp. CER19]